VLQAQQLPEDPLHPKFLELLGQVTNIFVTSSRVYNGATTLIGVPEQLLSLDLVPVLLGRLMRLDPHPQRRQEASSGVQGSLQRAAEAPAVFRSGSGGVSPACSADMGTLGAVTGIMTTLYVLLKRLSVGGKTAAGDGDSALVAIGQLLSSPAALKVAVQGGLSAEVQEASRAGSEHSSECMEAVCLFFRNAALVLCLHKAVTDADGMRRGEELCNELASFLQADENLPFLEPLCMPPADVSTPQSVLGRWNVGICCAEKQRLSRHDQVKSQAGSSCFPVRSLQILRYRKGVAGYRWFLRPDGKKPSSHPSQKRLYPWVNGLSLSVRLAANPACLLDMQARDRDVDHEG
jgi:hypothetical protein